MTRQEAAAVLAIMTAAFPGHEFSEDNAQVWYTAVLKDLDYEAGEELMRKLVTNPDRAQPHSFPKLSEFQAARRARMRALKPTRALPTAPPVDAATAKANIAALREKLPSTIKNARNL